MGKTNFVKIIYLLTAIVSIFMIFVFLGAYAYLKKANFLFTLMAILTLIAGLTISMMILKGYFSFSSKQMFKNKKSQIIMGICISVFAISNIYISSLKSKLSSLDIVILVTLLLSGIVFIISEPIENPMHK